MKIRYLKESQVEGRIIGIVITIPKSIKWSDYEKELLAVADGRKEMNFKVPTLPRKIKEGDRCYLCYNGNIMGWMSITSIGRKSFVCDTTNKAWSDGYYVSRSGKFHYLPQPIPCHGFQGYRYVKETPSGNIFI